MVFTALAAELAAAEQVDWEVVLTTVFISTVSSETNIAPRSFTSSQNLHSNSSSTERNIENFSSKNQETHRRRVINKRLFDWLSERQILLKEGKVKYPGNISDTYSSSSVLKSYRTISRERYLKWRTIKKSSHVPVFLTRHKREEKISCPEIGYSTRCICSEAHVNCDNVDTADILISDPITPKVENISASNVGLRIIPKIRHAPRLKKLLLSRNKIDAVNYKDLENFVSLENIDLSLNQLQVLNLSELQLERLKILNASHNKLTTFLLLRSNLTHLYLQRNSICDVSFLTHLQSLNYVDLSYNRIINIPEDTFKPLKWLYFLNLQNNQIQNVNFVSHITELLHTLVLSNNKITYFPDTSFKNSKIVNLYLDNNALTNLTFLIFVNAAEINLNDNPLYHINGKILEKKTKLKILNVSGTNLTSMDFITSIPSLISLGIEENNIICLPKQFLKTYTSLYQWFLLKNPLENLICPAYSRLHDQAVCDEHVMDGKVQIHMQDRNINDVMNCVLNNRKYFEDCDQECNSTSQMLLLPFLILSSIVFNVMY